MKADRDSIRRILFVTSGFDIPGGIANLAGSVLDALDELVSEGGLHRADVISLHDRRPPTRPGPGRTIAARNSKARLVSSLVRLVATRRPDLVLFDHVGPARSVRLLPRWARPAYAVMVHGLEIRPPVRPSTRRLLREASLVIANSGLTARQAIEVAGPEIASKVDVVNPSISRGHVEIWQEHDGRPKVAGQVVTVGRLQAGQPGKGHETLIEAWTSIAAVVPGAKLVVVGEGGKRPELERLAADLGLADHVTFTGHVSDRRLGGLYAESVAFAMPGRQDGFGIAFLEAMWHGLPCIGSDADAAREVIVDGTTGILVPFGDVEATADAITGLLTDESLGMTMGREGRHRCLELFSPAAFKERLADSLGQRAH